MKLHLTQAAGNNLITGYDNGWVEINKIRHTQSLIVMPDSIFEDWQATDFDSLTVDHFERIAELKPEVVLLGTGDKHRFIHPRLTAPLTALGVSVECMDTAAACRTYNILMAEGRHVAAALIN
jgi:uncharacterized protein